MATKQKTQEKTPPAAKSQGGAATTKPQGGAAALAAGQAPSRVQSLVRYFEDSKTELGKVSWPTKKEVRATSIAVVILVVVMSIFLGIADLLLAKIMEVILSMGL